MTNQDIVEQGHDARQVANEFLRLAKDKGRPLTPLQVQKLVYFAHAWMLGLHGRPMIDSEFEAWRYGPVVPVVYFPLSHFRGSPIDSEFSLGVHPDDDRPFSDDETSIIQQVFDLYGPFSGPQLSTMTHAPGTPWHQTKTKGEFYIPNKRIRQYYKHLIETKNSRGW